MQTDGLERPALDYSPCRYGTSRIDFRGPARVPEDSYVSVIGGSETYGKFVADPFTDRLERQIGEPVVNLGCLHAGLSIFATDASVIDVAGRARICVMQVLGAQNMSNRFYTVHPRRNDRFLGPSGPMQRLFPEVDFAHINFTGHLLKSLSVPDGDAIDLLHRELRLSWLARMRGLLQTLGCPVVLLWLAGRRPEDPWNFDDPFDPLFVDRSMLDELAPDIAGIVEISCDGANRRGNGLSGKVYGTGEAQAAAAFPGPAFHARVADSLARVVADVPIENEKRARDGPNALCL